MVDILDATVKLAVAMFAGMVIGINRDLHHKPTGVRTLGLVALATALLTMASLGFAEQVIDLNPVSRVIQGALTGIGFIGAGVIARDKDTGDVSGLTTAASVWITAALGVVCGLGAWKIVLVASTLTLSLLIVGGRIEDAIRKRVRRCDVESRKDLAPP